MKARENFDNKPGSATVPWRRWTLSLSWRPNWPCWLLLPLWAGSLWWANQSQLTFEMQNRGANRLNARCCVLQPWKQTAFISGLMLRNTTWSLLFFFSFIVRSRFETLSLAFLECMKFPEGLKLQDYEQGLITVEWWGTLRKETRSIAERALRTWKESQGTSAFLKTGVQFPASAHQTDHSHRLPQLLRTQHPLLACVGNT